MATNYIYACKVKQYNYVSEGRQGKVSTMGGGVHNLHLQDLLAVLLKCKRTLK